MAITTDRQGHDGKPTYSGKMHTSDTILVSKAGLNINSAGDAEIWDSAGTVQATIGTTGVTFLNPATTNSTNLTVGDGSVTTGNVFTLTNMSALTTGQGIKVVSSATAITTTGRLFLSTHSGATGTSAVLNEFVTSANDETVLLGLTAASLTTGTVLDFGTTAGLTTGIAIKIAHSTSAIGDGGSLIQISSSGVDTGGATNGTLLDIKGTGQLAGTQVRVDSIQTTGTVMSIISTGTMTTTGNLLTLTGNSATTAAGLLRVNGNGLTSGIGAVITSSATAITGAGRLLFVNHTGTTTSGGAGILNEFKSAGTDGTIILQVNASSTLTGTALNVSAAGVVTGTGLACTDNTALTSGILLSLASSATAITGAGRLLFSNHTGATGTSAVLNEFASAANDETVILRVTGSSTLATGIALNVSVANVTTGFGITSTDNTALTSGNLLKVASSATAITGAGRLFVSDHTGATGTSAILNEFKSAANDETIILQVTATTVLATGIALKVSTASMTTGTGISMLLAGLTTGIGVGSTDNTALTTGQLISIASSATAITTTGRMFISNHTGATGTSATLNEFASAATDETVIAQVTASGALALGVALNVSVAALTTGTGYQSTDNTALTTGALMSLSTSATAMTSAGRVFKSNHSGASSSSGNGILNEFATSATDGTNLIKLTASGLTTGTVLNVAAAALTTGKAFAATDNTALTSGILVHLASSATAITGAGRMIYSNHTGATGTSAILNEFASAANDETIICQVTGSAALAAGKALNVSVASMTTGTGLSVDNADAITTGFIGSFTSNSADTSARFLVQVKNTNAAAVGAVPLKLINAAVQGTGSKFVPLIRGTEGTKVFTMWLSIDATTPNGNLTGVVGDVCFNGPGGRMFECSVTGTTWIAANA